MVKLGKAFLFVATVYTAYYVGTISGYVHGTLTTCKAFVEKSDKKDNTEDALNTIKEVQEESNGQGSGN